MYTNKLKFYLKSDHGSKLKKLKHCLSLNVSPRVNHDKLTYNKRKTASVEKVNIICAKTPICREIDQL